LGVFQDLEKKFEDTFHRTHVIAGICSPPTLEQVRDLLEHAENVTKLPRTALTFANSVDALGNAGEKLGGAVDKINDLLEKGSSYVVDVNAACQISEAVSVLNDWTSGKTSNEFAAKAFDKLFGGAARFMGKLPFPANQYAKLLAEIGQYSFFANMQSKLDPMSSENEGAQLRQLDREYYQ
jgi:uncharacterized protein YgbK (DUF1537 family)